MGVQAREGGDEAVAQSLRGACGAPLRLDVLGLVDRGGLLFIVATHGLRTSQEISLTDREE